MREREGWPDLQSACFHKQYPLLILALSSHLEDLVRSRRKAFHGSLALRFLSHMDKGRQLPCFWFYPKSPNTVQRILP